MSQSEIKGKKMQLAPRAGRHITCFKRGKTYNLCQARANIQHLLSAGKRNLCQAWDNACKPCVSRAMLCLVLFEKKKNEWPERAWAHVLSFYFFNFLFWLRSLSCIIWSKRCYCCCCSASSTLFPLFIFAALMGEWLCIRPRWTLTRNSLLASGSCIMTR